MTNEQAANVVAVLNAGFPAEALEPATVEVYIREIAILSDPQVALEAAFLAVREGDRFPKIKDFRQIYRSVAERQRQTTPALIEPRDSNIPEWVCVWWWARVAQKDERVFPQQPHITGAAMTTDEYEQLRASWQQAGSPTVTASGLLAAVAR